MRRVLAVLALGCMVSSCALGRGMVLTRLYFGLSTPGGEVTAEQFSAFVDTAITPRFPEGLTKYGAEGQWRNREGRTVKESSVVVEIVHSADRKSQEGIQSIIESYKRAYAQESVLLVQQRPRVRF